MHQPTEAKIAWHAVDLLYTRLTSSKDQDTLIEQSFLLGYVGIWILMTVFRCTVNKIFAVITMQI